MPPDVVGWAQVAALGAATVAVLVWSVGQLFRTMSTNYAAIIAALQGQNADQERRLAQQRSEIASLQAVAGQLNSRVTQVERKQEQSG